jgi:hypothetical protein
MPGIVDQARIGATYPLGKTAERGIHPRPVEVAAVDDGKADALELLGDIVRIVTAILELWHRAVCTIADHESDARFGGARLGQQAERDHKTNSEAPDRGIYTHDRRRIGQLRPDFNVWPALVRS